MQGKERPSFAQLVHNLIFSIAFLGPPLARKVKVLLHRQFVCIKSELHSPWLGSLWKLLSQFSLSSDSWCTMVLIALCKLWLMVLCNLLSPVCVCYSCEIIIAAVIWWIISIEKAGEPNPVSVCGQWKPFYGLFFLWAIPWLMYRLY